MRRTHLTFALAAAVGMGACQDSPAPTAPDVQPAPAVELGSETLFDAVVSTGGDAATADITTPDLLTCSETAEVTVEVTGSTEAQPLDVIVLVDGSGSVGSAQFQQVRSAVADLISEFDWSPAGNHMGIIEFSTMAQTIHSLGNGHSGAALTQSALNMPYLTGWTFTRRGVQAAIDMFNADGRPGAQKVLLVITDGSPQGPAGTPDSEVDPCPLVPTLESLGAKGLLVGVGNFNTAEVACLVDDPVQDVFPIQAFDELAGALQEAIGRIPVASDVAFSAEIPSGFSLAGPLAPTAGTAALAGNVLTWTLESVGDATEGLTFDLAHDGVTGGIVPILTGMSLTFTSEGQGTVTNPAADATIQVDGCDTTPPDITPVVTGTEGDDGWYVSDVHVSWLVDDPESPFTIDGGCTDETVSADTDGVTFTCSASSDGGSASEDKTVKRDATPPTVVFDGNAGSYLVTDQVTIGCTVDDNLSGIAAQSCDGLDVPAWEVGLGETTLTGSATDNAGNDTDASTSFLVEATHDSLCGLVEQWVSNPGVARSLCGKLRSAQRAADRGRQNAADNIIEAFVNQVQAQSGKKIDADRAAILIELARAL